MLSVGLQSSPPKGGFLRDFADGYKDNRFNSFSIGNLSPAKKGFAKRFGEGLGTAVRFAESPVGRSLITAGAIGAFGGSPLQMAGYGASAGLMNQNIRNADSLYRKSLQEQGLDTSNIRGYIQDNTYKNYSLNNYRNESLDLRRQLGVLKDNTQRARMIGQLLNNGIITPHRAIELISDYGISVEDLQKSNATRNTDINENLAPYRANAFATSADASRENVKIKKEAAKAKQKNDAELLRIMQELAGNNNTQQNGGKVF